VRPAGCLNPCKATAAQSIKLNDMVAGVNQVAALEDPLGKVTLATQLDRGADALSDKLSIGVIGAILNRVLMRSPQIGIAVFEERQAVVLQGRK